MSSTGLSKPRFRFGFDRFSGLYIWAVFIIIFGIWTPNLFLSLDTVHLLASEQAVVGMLALAVMIPLVCGAFDLSVGANINLSAITVVLLQTDFHWSMWDAIVVAVVAGALFGAINIVVVVVLKVNSFIGTLGAATIIGAVQSIIVNGSQPFPPTNLAWTNLTQLPIAGFQIAFFYLIILALIVWWLLARTPAGRYMYAIGSNPEAARLSGVAVGKWTALSLLFSGIICGIAGVVYASLTGPSLTFGASLLLPAFAAVFLGSTQLKPGRFNVWGTMIAIFVLATGVQGLQLVTSVQWIGAMFNGVALILAVAFAGWRQRAALRARRVARESRHPSIDTGAPTASAEP